MGLTELVVDARVEQNAFRRGRLTGVDVRMMPMFLVFSREYCLGIIDSS